MGPPSYFCEDEEEEEAEERGNRFLNGGTKVERTNRPSWLPHNELKTGDLKRN